MLLTTQSSSNIEDLEFRDHPCEQAVHEGDRFDDSHDLVDFIENSIGDEHIRVDEDFGGGFVRLKSSEAQKRQAAQDIRCSEDILIELLRNSRDAGASVIFIATTKSDDKRSIVVIDDGAGIPHEMFDRVFEPRVTSKLDTSHMDNWGLHGRGMALYSIEVNTDSSEVVCSEVGYGCAIKVVSDTSKLDEKVDQSTFPRFELVDSKHMMRGPKNLIRTAVEFALEHRSDVNVFMGSPAEILSTIYSYGCSTIPAAKRAFTSNREQEKLFKRASFSADPASLVSAAADIGLDVSERTARRVIDGKIKSLPTLMDLLSSKAFPKQGSQKSSGSPKKVDRIADGHLRTIHPSDEDVVRFRSDIAAAFCDMAERYYLLSDVDIDVAFRNGEIRISIPTIDAAD